MNDQQTEEQLDRLLSIFVEATKTMVEIQEASPCTCTLKKRPMSEPQLRVVTEKEPQPRVAEVEVEASLRKMEALGLIVA